MAASFAAYASQFLNREQQQSSMSSSQPLFFSFTTDNESNHGNAHELDLDDLDDPHFRTTAPSKWPSRRGGNEEEDDDPYLRLDEEDQISRNNSHSMRLLDSHHGSEPESSKGWLAHQASPLRNYRSSSPSSSSERSESSSESGIPPPDILTNRAPPPLPSRYARSPSLPPPPLTSLSLTESLLPRDGTIRPMDVFSLPDPRHISRKRRKFSDSVWTVVWCTGLTLCLFFSILILFLTHEPSYSNRVKLPYTTLLHTVPMLTILIILSAAVSYAHIFLLRIFVKPVMIATSVFIPATLFISAIWAFIGSFMWDADTVPTWGETIGLRLFSLVPLVLSLLTARRLLDLPRDIHTTSSLLTLTTRLLRNNPFLLGLSPAVLLASLIASIPFLTLTFRLLLVGQMQSPGNPSGSEWHVRGWVNWAIVATVAMWLWSWGVARGVLRVTCAGVIGAWYFADPSLPVPPPSSTHTIHAALIRATSPSLGTIVLSALIITAIRLLSLVTILLRRVSTYLPLPMRPYLQPLVIAAGYAAGYLENATKSLSTYALIYTGLTGDAFFPSARRARALTSAVNTSVAKYKKRFRTEPPLTMLTYAPLTLTFPFSLSTYLFVAHTLGAPDQALSASVLSGGVTALVGLFCVGLVKDTADTLYICYCIDQDAGRRRRNEVFNAFEYEIKRSQAAVAQPQRPAVQQPPALQSTRVTPPQPISTTPVRQHRLQSPIAVDRARVPTPDPFEQSPIDDAEEDLETARPTVSTSTMGGYHIDDESTITKSLDKLDMKASGRSNARGNTSSGDEGENESQLFPGSDIF